jgi:hypothetical protein
VQNHNIKITTDKGIIQKAVINRSSKEIEDKIIVTVGKEMIVKPLNKSKLKHRDRRVIINKIVDEGWKGIRASVKFVDNNRIGKVDIIDLDDLV